MDFIERGKGGGDGPLSHEVEMSSFSDDGDVMDSVAVGVAVDVPSDGIEVREEGMQAKPTPRFPRSISGTISTPHTTAL